MLSPTVKAALIALAVSWWVIPMVQHQQKLEDRQYEALAEVAVVSSDIHQGIWNFHFAVNRQREGIKAMRHYREQAQKAFSAGQGVRAKLPLLFRDATIAKDWNQALNIYRDIAVSLDINNIDDVKLDRQLMPAFTLVEAVKEKIRAEIHVERGRF